MLPQTYLLHDLLLLNEEGADDPEWHRRSSDQSHHTLADLLCMQAGSEHVSSPLPAHIQVLKTVRAVLTFP